jgi:RNA polymerase sigma factor (sigma-70 family)
MADEQREHNEVKASDRRVGGSWQPEQDRQMARAKGRHRKALRRVRIMEDQQRALEHARAYQGFSGDVSPHAHDDRTFRMIQERKALDSLPGSEFIVPKLDEWKHWTKMRDWDSRNRQLEELTGKLRRREASSAELQFLVIVCGPALRGVVRSLWRYGGVDDDLAGGRRGREEAVRVRELDRRDLEQVVQDALIDALHACPQPFPRRFFPWLRATLAHRALDYVRQDICEHGTILPHDAGITEVVDRLLPDHQPLIVPGSPAYSQWLRSLDVPGIFELAKEYVGYARVRSACEGAVERLPDRQQRIIRDHYFEEMTQAEIAHATGLADSTVRNTHSHALRNLRRDDTLFCALEAVGAVRDLARRQAIQRAHELAPAAATRAA